MHKLGHCRNVSVYLGGNCNFDCRYCDRGPIKDSVGYSAMRKEHVPAIVRFLEDVSEDMPDGRKFLPLDIISFFGGEPFVFIIVMDEVIRQVSEKWPEMKFFIQTNGSLILKHEEFIRRWGDKLRISISHDFSFQGLNRTVYDIDATLELLRDAKVDFIQMQHVLPVNRPDAFSIDHFSSIVKVFARHKVDRLSLIPLRHLRGHGRFTTFVKDVPLDVLFKKLLQMVQLLWVQGVNVVVDGMESGIEKSYFDDHKQLVLGPDGYLYPEFDFVEYKVEGARVGEWLNATVLNRSTSDDHLIWDTCKACPARHQCGIKYLYRMFSDEAPDGFCAKVNQMYMMIIRHNLKLKSAPNLFDLVGV